MIFFVSSVWSGTARQWIVLLPRVHLQPVCHPEYRKSTSSPECRRSTLKKSGLPWSVLRPSWTARGWVQRDTVFRSHPRWDNVPHSVVLQVLCDCWYWLDRAINIHGPIVCAFHGWAQGPAAESEVLYAAHPPQLCCFHEYEREWCHLQECGVQSPVVPIRGKCIVRTWRLHWGMPRLTTSLSISTPLTGALLQMCAIIWSCTCSMDDPLVWKNHFRNNGNIVILFSSKLKFYFINIYNGKDSSLLVGSAPTWSRGKTTVYWKITSEIRYRTWLSVSSWNVRGTI